MGGPSEVVAVLIVASGAAWESEAMTLLGEHPGIVVLKRCVDVDDLLAAATAGQADAAVLALDSPGLDVAAVEHLDHHRVRPVAIIASDAVEAGRLRAWRRPSVRRASSGSCWRSPRRTRRPISRSSRGWITR